jgi:shikimate kinase
MAPKAVLVGMPGSGKSTIGRRLAKALAFRCWTTDVAIVETTGRSIADIFTRVSRCSGHRGRRGAHRAGRMRRCGVARRRRPSPPRALREALKGHTVIYLEISAAEGVRRTTGSNRPLLAGDDSGEKYRALMEARVPRFREVATMRDVNTKPTQPGCGGAPHRHPAAGLRTGPVAAPPPAGLAARPHRPEPGTHHRGPAHPRRRLARKAEARNE